MSEKQMTFAEALVNVQSQLVHVKRDTEGYGYKYAQLDQCWDTIKKPLQDNGFSLIQLPYNEDDKIGIHSVLLHTSGEKMESRFAMTPVKNDPQAVGSLLTYFRRYSLMSIIGLCPEDDDATNAMPEYPKTAGDVKKVFKKQFPDKTGTYPKDIYGICSHCQGWIHLSKSGKTLYCENWMDNKEHDRPNYSDQPKLPGDIRAGVNAKQEALKWYREKSLENVDTKDIGF